MHPVLLVPTHKLLSGTEGTLVSRTPVSPTAEGVVELTKEMLNWPFHYADQRDAETESKELWEEMYRNALRALLLLDTFFTSAICLRVDTEGKTLSFAKRDWGQISLGDRLLVTFSHDTREKNRPFSCLSEWPETGDAVPLYWTAERWYEFFKGRVADAMRNLSRDGQQRTESGQADMEFAAQVLGRIA